MSTIKYYHITKDGIPYKRNGRGQYLTEQMANELRAQGYTVTLHGGKIAGFVG